jgi:hypothetical protein
MGMGKTAGVLIGDRENPLEADVVDVIRDSPLIGKRAEVSPAGGGDTMNFRGKTGEITGVFMRFGKVVGFEVDIKGTKLSGTLKDFYVDPHNVLEDVQPPTAVSVAVREALSHWREQRTYWKPFLDGLEQLCFELAGVTHVVGVEVQQGCWTFHIPDPMGMSTSVRCSVCFHDNYWTMSTSVFPRRAGIPEGIHVLESSDHWERTYLWVGAVASHVPEWADALDHLRARAEVTRRIVIPTMVKQLQTVKDNHLRLFGELENPTPISMGISTVRLKPGTIAMTEPPTDRKPYTVITLSPEIVKPRDELFSQTIMHELIHYAVASRGGEPHNKEFHALAEATGLKPKYRR